MITQKISVLFDAHNINKKAGGVEIYNKNLIRCLARQGIKLHLYSNKSFKKRKNIFVPAVEFGFYRILKGFRDAIRISKPQIIHCNNFLPYPAPTKPKKVVMIHDFCFLKEKNDLSRYLQTTCLRYSLLNADHVITNSNFTLKQLLKFLGAQANNIKTTVIHLGVDPVFKSIDFKKAKAFVKKNYQIQSDYFLFPGNITKRKNLRFIVFLAKRLLSKGYDTNIVLTGVKPKSFSDLPKNILFLNYVPQNHLNYLYNACLALIYPSLCEGFALPIIEASRTKTPVICSPIPCIQEVAKDSVLYAKNRNEWFKNIQTVIQNKYPKKLISMAHQNSLAYTWGKTAKKTLEVYEQLLNE